MQWLTDFWNQFYGEPEFYYNDFSIEYIIRAESVHFLSSAFAGVLVYWILITLLQKHTKLGDLYISRVCFWWSLSVALLVHVVIIDGMTKLA